MHQGCQMMTLHVPRASEVGVRESCSLSQVSWAAAGRRGSAAGHAGWREGSAEGCR